MSAILRKPGRPPATGPTDERYFDARDLETELRRVFQICHECRMCIGYCGAFPALFDRIDRDIASGVAEGAEKLEYDDFQRVTGACWQCKLCYIKCPYTADEGAAELVDFPRLMAREKALRAARDGVPLVDKILGEPHIVGRLQSGIAAPIAKLVQASRLVRKVQESVTGISAEFPLPQPARETFGAWFDKHLPIAGRAGEVVLYATCLGDFNVPTVPIAAVRVLEHNGIRVLRPGAAGDDSGGAELSCCGMPNVDGGDVAGATTKIRENVAVLIRHVRKGRRVVVLQPTCSYMVKKEWVEYVPGPDTEAVAAAAVDVMELLVALARDKKLNREFERGLGTVAYHVSCHLRAQKIGVPGSRILGLVPDTEVRLVEQCSAVDGTWGMKAENYETGRKYAQKLVRGVADLRPDLVVSDCSLSGLRIDKENAVRVVHPIEAVAQAYGL